MVNPTTTGDSDKAEVSSAVAANSDCALANFLPAADDETAGVGVWSLPRSGGRGGGRTRYRQ